MSLLWRKRSELHPDQMHAIEGLSASGRYLLLGPPGSGKTSILLHRGQYLRLPPNNLANTRLITFSRTLREFIAVNGDDRFPPNLIRTVRELVSDVFKAYHEILPVFPKEVSLVEQNRAKAATALDIIAKHGPKIHFDCLLVDEIQDLSPEEIQLFGRVSDRLMFVGDSRQKLFEADGAIDAATALGCVKAELKHHYRISYDICNVADAILLQGDYRLAEYCHYQGPAPTPPAAMGGLSRAQQLNRLLDRLDVQIDTYNDPSDLIGIVVWKQADCDALMEELIGTRFEKITTVFHSGVKDRKFVPGLRVCIMTLQSCKGLEFRALHWLYADENSYFITRERAYTVVTRAKSSLTIYHNAPLPDCLAGSIVPPALGRFEDE